jgi:hypothetical protein
MAIGFSTGCFYRADMDLYEKIRFCSQLGTDAIEISMATLDELKKVELSKPVVDEVNKFDYVSVHAPWKEIRYRKKNPEAEEILEKLKEMCSVLPVQGVVMHVHRIDDFSLLSQAQLPFLLENNDKRKSFGILPSHFRQLGEICDFGYVLDVEHAYEIDPTMDMAKIFVSEMNGRLKEMHVSGSTESEIHYPTYRAENSHEIAEILKLKIDVPIILEGVLGDNMEKMPYIAANELKFVRKFY